MTKFVETTGDTPNNEENEQIPSWLVANNKIKTRDQYGNYQLDYDKDAAKLYFIENINKRTVFFHNLKEKLDFLIEGNFYKKELYDMYKFEDIKEIFKIAYAKKFRFQSYMAASKFYDNYALKTNDKKHILERYEDRVSIFALFKAKGNMTLARKYVNTVMGQVFQPATPVFLNAGRARGGKEVSCFIVHVNDSTEGILYADGAVAQLSRMGGAIGLNLTDLRSINDPIKGIEGAAGGPIGVAKKFEHTAGYFDQLGQRDGSAAVYLSVMHYDIEDFISTKKINADEQERLKTVSLGVLVPDVFFQKALLGQKMYVFSPYYIEKYYGIKLSEVNMNEMYETFANDSRLKKKQIDARDMLTKISGISQESGYPYIIYIDNANNAHALKNISTIKCSNLCVEIFQGQISSDIKGYTGENKFGTDVSCVLGSNNIYELMKSKDFKTAMEVSVRILNAVVDDNVINEVPTVANGNDLFKAIGIGDLNLHGYLVKSGVKYSDTVHVVDFVRAYYSTKRFWAIYWSMMMAKETGDIFHGFKGSDYENGKIFEQYKTKSFAPKTDKVKQMFEGIEIPTQEDWAELELMVKKYGMRNGYLFAIAPTGSISYVQNATASVLPITELIETRSYADRTTYYPAPFLKEAFFLYNNETAFDISSYKIIDVIAEIQKHVDQGISMTLFIPSTATTADISKLYLYGWKKGLKSIYYLRTKLIDETCEACSI